MAYLIVEQGNCEDIGKTFSLDERTVLIGCPSLTSKPDLPITDRYVSRRHAEISYQQGYYVLRDVGSLNGTEIDGQLVERGRPYRLWDGAAIGLAIVQGKPRVVLRFRDKEDTTPAPRAYMKGQVDWLEIDEDKKQVWVDGKPLFLSRKEYSLILLLYRKAGNVCSKDEIVSAVWPEVKDAGAVSDATIGQLVHRLREKVELDLSRPVRIITVKDWGYKLA